MINDMGITVYEKAPDAESLILSDSAVSNDEDAAEEAAAGTRDRRRRVRPHDGPRPHVHARDGHRRAAHARRRDSHREAHRGRPRSGALGARAVPADGPADFRHVRRDPARRDAPAGLDHGLHRSERADRGSERARRGCCRRAAARRGERRSGRRRGGAGHGAGSRGSRGAIEEAEAAAQALPRDARGERRQGRGDQEGAEVADERVHGAQARAEGVRRARRPAARRHQSGPQPGTHGHGAVRARRRNAAQGLHRELPEERDEPSRGSTSTFARSASIRRRCTRREKRSRKRRSACRRSRS